MQTNNTWDQAAWLDAARAILSPAAVITDDLAPYTRDWRGKFDGAAVAVLKPATVAEVQGIVELCAKHGVKIVPQGGNTSVCGASVPGEEGRQVVISLARLNKVREVDVENSTITVEAGCILQNVQERAAAENMLFPLSLGAQGSCQIGGNISTNAGGIQVLRYGNTRELVLGLEVVLPNGELIDLLKGLRKDNTGYDLKQLFIGAEGTLGIITAATLKLFPLPTARVTALAGLADVNQAPRLLNALRAQLGDRVSAFELISAPTLELVKKYFPDSPTPLADSWPWVVLLEVADGTTHEQLSEALQGALGAALEAGLLQDVALANTIAQGNALWTMRENLAHAQQLDGNNIKHDISVPVSRIAEFVTHTVPLLLERFPGSRPFVFGHLGDGNLHFNLSAPPGQTPEQWQENTGAVNDIVHGEVVRNRGSISAEHGIGQLKKDEMEKYKSPAEMRVMRAVKAALDPLGIMNPGKILAGAL